MTSRNSSPMPVVQNADAVPFQLVRGHALENRFAGGQSLCGDLDEAAEVERAQVAVLYTAVLSALYRLSRSGRKILPGPNSASSSSSSSVIGPRTSDS